MSAKFVLFSFTSDFALVKLASFISDFVISDLESFTSTTSNWKYVS